MATKKKMIKERGGMEAYTSKSAMKKHEKAESKSFEKKEEKSAKSKKRK